MGAKFQTVYLLKISNGKRIRLIKKNERSQDLLNTNFLLTLLIILGNLQIKVLLFRKMESLVCIEIMHDYFITGLHYSYKILLRYT